MALLGAPGWFGRRRSSRTALIWLQPCRLEPLRPTPAPNPQELLERQPSDCRLLPCALHDRFRHGCSFRAAQLLPVHPCLLGHVIGLADLGRTRGLARAFCSVRSRGEGIRKGESGIRNPPGLFSAGWFCLTGGLTCLNRVSTLFAWCWYGAIGFLDVWVLVLVPLHDLDSSNSADRVPLDESAGMECVQHGLHVAIVVRHNLGLDALWSVFHASAAVSNRPEANEKEARHGIQLCETVMGEKPWLDVPGARHQAWPSNFRTLFQQMPQKYLNVLNDGIGAAAAISAASSTS